MLPPPPPLTWTDVSAKVNKDALKEGKKERERKGREKERRGRRKEERRQREREKEKDGWRGKGEE